jgi:hypothetical protein
LSQQILFSQYIFRFKTIIDYNLIFIRKYLKTLPIYIIWGWLFVFFADSANLDDFISHVTVIHTDELIENSNEDDSADNNVPDHYTLSKLPDNQSLSQSTRIIYDIDSPSIAPDLQGINKEFSENITNKKITLKSVSISKLLYIQFHSLLI